MHKLDLTDTANRTLPRVLQLQAEANGDGIFLMQGDVRYTFDKVDRLVNRLARGLASLGVAAGDRVAFFMKSRVEVIFLTLAVNRLGALWIPVNTDYKREWLRDTIAGSRPSVLVTDTALIGRLEEVISQLPPFQVVVHGDGQVEGGYRTLASLFDFPDDAHDHARIGYGDISAVLWTSGTTGRSKGVMQSHNVWIRSAEYNNGVNFDIQPGDVVYNTLPVYNSAAWSANIFRSLVGGLPCGLDPTFSVTRFWDRIRHYGATQTFTLGAMHVFLWNAPASPDDRNNPLRIAGMTPTPDALVAPFCERFGLDRIVQGFGQSEALGLISRHSQQTRRLQPGALGTANTDVELRLLDEDGKVVANGEIGEIGIRPLAPHVIFSGYLDDPAATAAAFTADGFYRMGDLGRLDTDGALHFVDRKKDAVRYAGRNISSMEVESAVRRHPAVAEVAAFGIPSTEIETEAELAIHVVLTPGETVSPEDLARFINDNAPYFFVPQYIEFVDALPYTPTNKVQKYLLRERGVTAATWDRKAAAFVTSR